MLHASSLIKTVRAYVRVPNSANHMVQELQKFQIERECDKLGWSLDRIVYDWGCCGDTPPQQREGLIKLMLLVQPGEVLMVAELAHLSQKSSHLQEMIEWCRCRDVQLYVVSHQTNILSMDSTKLLRLCFSEEEQLRLERLYQQSLDAYINSVRVTRR